MARIREVLTLEDQFSNPMSRFLQFMDRAVNGSAAARAAAGQYANAQRMAGVSTQSAAQTMQTYQAVANSVSRRLVNLNSQFNALMQEQQAMVSAGQQGSAAFLSLDKTMEQLGGEIRRLQSQSASLGQSMAPMESAATRAAAAQDKLNRKMSEGASGAGALAGKLKTLLGAYLGLQGVKAILGLSDAMTQTTARLERMNDGLQTTAELNEMIYQSAQRSRGAYADTANMVSKLGTLAGNAFSNSAEVVAFAEQINKQIALSGTSAVGAQAAMLQLTQAMSSGVLRGEELNSILEQTPMIAQSIAKYLGVSTGKMRELAAEGALTADIVKAAMFEAAEETNKAFEDMPVTWAQMASMAQNILMKGFRPALDFIASIPQVIMDNWEMLVPVFAGIAAVVGVLAVQALIMAGAFLLANWPLLLLGAAVAAFAYGMMEAGATAEDVFEVIGQGFGFLYAFVGNIIVDLYNLWAAFAEFFANVFDNPVQAVANLFFDLVDSILGLLQTVAGAIDALFGSNLAGAVEGWRNSLSAWVDENIGANKIQIERMDKIDYSATMAQFGAYGRGIGEAMADFSAPSGMGGFDYDSLAGNIGDISKSVGNIDKTVNMADEDLKSLVDMAERKYVNNINLTAQTPVINVNGQNTGDTAADRQGLANAIRDILVEQASYASVRSTAKAF